jgi:ADP-ribose pyrophosphatase YjhB (NUDIX family)
MYKFKYPVAFHSVDMAITRMHEGKIQVLLAQKVKDTTKGKNVWRFPGGFIDPWDCCAEESALRESMEETGMVFTEEFVAYFKKKAPLVKKLSSLIEDLADESEISAQIKKIQEIKIPESCIVWLRENTKYIGSTIIDDDRYRDTDHKIITTFYELSPISGKDKDGEGPFDDIARTKWFNIHEVKEELMHPAHKVLFKMLFEKHKIKMHFNKIGDTLEKMGEDLSKSATSIVNSIEEIFKSK